MNWLRRIGRPNPPDAAAPAEPLPEPAEWTSPGLAALLEKVSEDRSHAVLDLGLASPSSLRIYSRYARRVRFAGLLAAAASREAWATALRAIPPQPQRPYDLLFAWDLLDRIGPEERVRLVERLTEVTAADARLHVLVDTSASPTAHPLLFSLLDVDRVRSEPIGSARSARSPVLAAELGRLLVPFHVVHAFTLKTGLREYVAVRRGT